MRAEQPSETPCLICITGRGATHPKRICYYSEDNIQLLFEALAAEPETRLLYYRRFGNTFDALAHKLMLENLSPATVKHNIGTTNKSWDDLLPRLRCELDINLLTL